jgi:hypothetical protein
LSNKHRITLPKTLVHPRILIVPGDDAPLEELCRPLSARVLPRSALIAGNGDVLDVGRVMAKARIVNRQPEARASDKLPGHGSGKPRR